MAVHLRPLARPGHPRSAAPSPRAVVAVLALSGAVVSLTQSVILPLLPIFPEIFGASAADVSWLATASLVAGAVATPLLGRLGDMFGKRRMMLICLNILVASSVLCALATTLPLLLLGRVLQGASIGLVPLAISALNDLVPSERLGSGIALVSATLGIGAGVGLPLAGVVAQQADWHAVFWATAVFAAVSLALVAHFVPESDLRSGGRVDVPGAVGLSLILVALLLVVTKGQEWGWTTGTSIGLLAFGFGGGVVWWRYERGHASPLVDVAAVAHRPVLLTNIASVLLGVGMFANNYVTTAHAQIPTSVPHGFGASIVVAGLVMLPGAVTMVALSPLSPRISVRYGPRFTLATGGAVMAAGFLSRVLLTGSLWELALGAVIVSVGVGIAYGAMPALILASVSPSITGSATSINTLSRAGGASIGSAATAAILAAVTVDVAGGSVPTLGAIQGVVVLAAACAAVAAAVAMRVPGHRPRLEVEA